MSEFSFTERTPLEAGFAEVFERRLVPVLERHEATRRRLRGRAKQWMAGIGVAGLGGAGAGFGFAQEVLGFASAAFGGAGVYGAKVMIERNWQAGLGAEVIPVLCEFLGGMTHGRQDISPAEFSRLGLVGSFNNAHLEDPVVGRHKEIDWAITEARLTRRSRDSKGRSRTTTVFQGLLFRIAVDHPAPRIFFARDRGSAVNWLAEQFSSARSGLERVEVPDPEFERSYEVYSDNPAAARAYIGPGLVEGLKLVAAHEIGGGYVGCAFEGDWLYIALPRRTGFLSLGSLFSPVSEIEEDLHAALADLDLPRRIIDLLSGR